MPQYLLSVHGDESQFAALESQPDVVAALYAAVEDFNQQLRDSGAWVFAGGLQPTSTASVVSPDGTSSDGPYMPVKEPMGGFWVIEAADLDAARTWAKQGSAACQGPVEVRPFQVE
jgi:hypothetical protein